MHGSASLEGGRAWWPVPENGRGPHSMGSMVWQRNSCSPSGADPGPYVDRSTDLWVWGWGGGVGCCSSAASTELSTNRLQLPGRWGRLIQTSRLPVLS